MVNDSLGDESRNDSQESEANDGRDVPPIKAREILQEVAESGRSNFCQIESASQGKQTDGQNTDISRPWSLTRRSAVKALGISGLVGGNFLGVVRGANLETKEVPELLSGGEVVSYMEVPTDWHQHRNQSRAAKRKLLNNISNRPYVFDISLTAGNETYGGEPGFQIRVRVTDTEKEAEIPDEVDNVPVSVEPAPESHGFGGCYNAQDEEYATGGEAVGWEGHGFGTCATGVNHDNKSETHLLHCAHVFWSDCDDAKSGGLKGRDAYRGTTFTSTTKIGQVTENWDRKGDYAIIEPDGDSSFSEYIDENDDYPSVAGALSQNKIDNMASSDDTEPIKKMGVTNGKNDGDIVASDVSFTFTCINFRDEGVEATTDFGNGDSGGPTYLLRNGDAYISHVSAYRYYDRGAVDGCDNDTNKEIKIGNAVGTAGYYIRNNEPITFG